MITLASLLTMGRGEHLFAKEIIPILGKNFEVFGVEKRSKRNFRVYLTKYFWVDVSPQIYVVWNRTLPEFQYSVITYKEVIYRVNNPFEPEYSFIRGLDEVLREIKNEFKSKLKRFWHSFHFNRHLKNSLFNRNLKNPPFASSALSPSLKFLVENQRK